MPIKDRMTLCCMRMHRSFSSAVSVGVYLAFWIFAAGALRADSTPFYAGKQITFIVGIGAGDTYDSYARLLAPHLAEHLAGKPQIVVVNRPGAGSLNAVNSLYNVSPRDGTAIGTGHRFVPLMPLLGMAGAQFDA